MLPANETQWPSRRPDPPCLRFAPLAWLKLQMMCHLGDTEIGGFGISSADDLLYVQDVQTVRQDATAVTVRFHDDAVADYFDSCVDQGISMERAGRIWLHTHPDSSPEPSIQDEMTFARSFGRCAWSVMFIVSRTCATYARLAFSAGPGGQMLIPVAVDWSAWPRCADSASSVDAQTAAWLQEYLANVHVELPLGMRLVESTQDEAAEIPRRWWETDPWTPDLDTPYALEDLEDGLIDPEAARHPPA